MLDYLLRRLAGTVPVLLAVSAFVFLFVHLLPGDPARLVAGPDATPQDIAAVRADMASTMPTLLLTVFSIRSCDEACGAW